MKQNFRNGPLIKWIRLMISALIISVPYAYGSEHNIPPLYEPNRPSPRIEPENLPPLNEGTELSDYIFYAILKNPGLRASFETFKSAIEKVVVTKALPDPMVSYTHFIEEIQTRTGPQESRIMFSQKFPWFGKLKTKGEIADFQAKSMWWNFETKRLEIIRNIKKTFYSYLLLKESLGLVKNNLELLQKLEPIVQKRIQGGANQNDLLRLQVEIGKLENQLDNLTYKRPAFSSKLNALLGRKEDTILPWPAEFKPTVHTIQSNSPHSDWVQNNTELKSLQKLKLSKEKALHLAKLQRYPNLGVGISFMQTGEALNPNTSGSGDDPLSLTVSASIPLWVNKNKAIIEEAKHNLSALSEQIENKENLLESELSLIVFELEDTGRQVLLYQDVLLPRAKQSLKITETSYQSSKASLLEVIDSQRTLIHFELLFWKAATKHEQSLAHLEWIKGENRYES